MKIARVMMAFLVLASVAYIVQQQPSAASQGPSPRPAQGPSHRLADSMQAKLAHIRENGERPNPDQTPTVLTEEEVNDYLASGRVTLPQGVKKVSMEGRTGVVTAFLTVNFDEIRAGQSSSNPLLSVFSGQHDVRVEGDAAASGGQGTVHVREVSIDGFTVPRMALEFFVSKYITPKYPDIGLDSKFKLPNRVDTATVGYHKLTLTQK
jgi:hypothetical protein